MTEKVDQLRTLVSALEKGEPVADQLQALGSDKLTQLRTELEDQIRQSKETGGAVLPEKLATMEGLRGLLTDLIHGTLQSYFMDTLLDTHEERLRTAQTNAPEIAVPETRRRSATVSAFDTPPAASKPTAPKKPPTQNAFQRFLTTASTFLGGAWESIKGFFSSWFPKKETPAVTRPSEPSVTTPPVDTRTPTEIYNDDPPPATPPTPTDPSTPSPPPRGGEPPVPVPETSGGAPSEAQDLLTSSVKFEGHIIELSTDAIDSFLTIDGVPYAARKALFIPIPVGGGALRAVARSVSLSPEGVLTISMGKDSAFIVSKDELHRILETTLSSRSGSIPLTIAYKNVSGVSDTFGITLDRK